MVFLEIAVAVLFIAVIFLAVKYIYLRANFEQRIKEWMQKEEARIRRDAIERSARTLSGKALEKLVPFLDRFPYNAHDLKILVMDGLVGSDAVPQCQMFNDAVGVGGVIFTKNDVNPKGGSILSVAYLIKKPILFLGVGQNHNDLKEFDKKWFVDQLIS